MSNSDKIILRTIEEEMRTAYIDYSMSVIVSRALPDVRDGLKPVHRRVLYGMSELGLASNRPHKKSARIVGEVLGKYHPHGDSAVYDTMVRMAQEWSLRYPLVDGQGNFGSIDGDSPAAMRYTEARLRRIAEELLEDINKNTVDFRPNFDDSLTEPIVLPARVPNLLINGSSGIAVGMATNMPPHNLREVVQGIIAYIDNRDITIEELMKFVKAPDFPTGGIIYGYEGVRQAFLTGRGKVITRARANIETQKNGRERIIITEIPYQVNKASLVEKIADLVGDKKIEGIAEIRDESDRDGLRVVIDIKRDGNPQVVLNNLYKQTALQTTFGVNNIALVANRPMVLNLKDQIHYFVEHRHEVIVRRTTYDLEQARARAHILEGLIIALDNLDAVIRLIREARTPEIAREGLITNFSLSEIQAKAILDMRLQRLTGLEMDKIRAEYQEVMRLIAYYMEVLANEPLRMKIIKDELAEVSQKYGDERRTEIVYSAEDFRVEDMIADEDVVITISHQGYIKRTPVANYRKQGRGGTGAVGATTKEEDFLEHLFIASTHHYMLFFTEKGNCFWLKVFEIPESGKTTKGRPIQNLISIAKDDKIKAFINVKSLEDPEELQKYSVVMCTKRGVIKKSPLEAYSRPRSSGIIAININEGDELIEAKLTENQSYIILASRNGRAIRFEEDAVRDMGRQATGVRGITLDESDPNDEVIGMVVVKHKDTNLLVVSEKGYGKKSHVEEYRITNRGGKGVITMNINEKTGKLIAIKEVTDANDLMIITRSGITLRIAVKEIRETGRNAMGVRLIRLKDDSEIAAVAKLAESNENTDKENTTLFQEDTE
ncbi:MAG: DNA gyrase subunit A [Bacteroidia bacterium]|nr:DNA gyrase subunit A [Bacteroidia bacterium]